MDQKTMEITIPNLAADQYFKLNPEVVGYYRVHYSPEDLERLCSSVQVTIVFVMIIFYYLFGLFLLYNYWDFYLI